jgi:membrane protein implicated in regulation of membrane protease activity
VPVGTIALVDDPELWRWVWLAAAVTFGLGEMASAGTFFLAPFALGAVLAAVLSFAGVPVAIGWLVFVLASAGAFAALRPLARRLDASSKNPLGVGAGRLVGEHGVVLTEVPAGPDELGSVRIGREEWRAEALDGGPLAPGTHVTVLEVRGTRVIVYPTGLPASTRPPERPH